MRQYRSNNEIGREKAFSVLGSGFKRVMKDLSSLMNQFNYLRVIFAFSPANCTSKHPLNIGWQVQV